ncbi:hypothetical protein R4369_37300 [Rhodococcus opacus]|nr:hypothetical protein [Rhodococcus opacus]
MTSDVLHTSTFVNRGRHRKKHDRRHDVRQRRGVTLSNLVVPTQYVGDDLLGPRDDAERFRMVGFFGVAEDHLPQAGASVVDLGGACAPGTDIAMAASSASTPP